MLKVINEIVEDMLNEILDNIESGSEDSLGLTLSDSDDQLPCSEDFQFFLNIARTVPSYSPGPETQHELFTTDILSPGVTRQQECWTNSSRQSSHSFPV